MAEEEGGAGGCGEKNTATAMPTAVTAITTAMIDWATRIVRRIVTGVAVRSTITIGIPIAVAAVRVTIAGATVILDRGTAVVIATVAVAVAITVADATA